MSDLNAEFGITATIKFGRGYEDPWLVFRGVSSEGVKRDIAEAFGVEVEGLTLAEAIQNATRAAHGVRTTVRTLGATVIPPSTETATGASEAGADDEPDAWAEVESTSAASTDENPVLTAIRAATSVADLKTLWAEQKSAFESDEELLAAWKARGRELTNKDGGSN